MTMTTPIETFEDILAAMENNPRLQAAMRQHVLDQEFLQLPAIVRELQRAVTQLTQLVHNYIATTDARLEQMEIRLEQVEARMEQVDTRLEQVEIRLEQVEARLDRLETGQAQLAAGQARLEGNVNRLIGSDYERKAARRASRLANRYLGIADMRVIYAVTMPDNNRLPEILDDAINAGLINASEADELEEVDIVMHSPSEYAVAEVSVTVDENDVRRAQDRAQLLSKAITEPVQAAVISAHALDTASHLAAANHVTIMLLPE